MGSEESEHSAIKLSHNSFRNYNAEALYLLLVFVALVAFVVFAFVLCARILVSNANLGSLLFEAKVVIVNVDDFEGFSELECCICLGGFEDGEKVKVLPNCEHAYHSLCVDKWLSSHSSCPLCRDSL